MNEFCLFRAFYRCHFLHDFHIWGVTFKGKGLATKCIFQNYSQLLDICTRLVLKTTEEFILPSVCCTKPADVREVVTWRTSYFEGQSKWTLWSPSNMSLPGSWFKLINGLFQIIMNLPLWRTSEFHTFFSPFCIGIHTFFRQFCIGIHTFFRNVLGIPDFCLPQVWEIQTLFWYEFLNFILFPAISSLEWEREGIEDIGIPDTFGHAYTLDFYTFFPLTYSGRYRGHWNSIQFCIHVIVWFLMLLKTRQYNQHDTGREKLLCEYELMKT